VNDKDANLDTVVKKLIDFPWLWISFLLPTTSAIAM
jgi:hypothetical protein